VTRRTTTPIDPETSLRQQINQLQRWAKTPDRTAATAAARAKAEGRWLAQVREEFPDVDDATAQKMADARRKIYFLDLSKRALAARKARRLAAQVEQAVEAELAEFAGEATA
jgi:hypothetical protein